MISPHFPPDSSAGTHRVRLLAPHLASYGWTPTVLTVAEQDYEGRIDPELGALVPPSLEDLFSRLQARATESADELDIRQRNAALELARQEDYDHVVRNDTGEVARTAARIDEIIRSEKAANPDRRTRV